MVKKILLAIAAVLIIIQFFRPKKNDAGDSAKSIGKLYTVPPVVDTILKKACDDCHSNKTRYPWYARVQPVGWWLASHIRDGKRHLNFDDFAGARIARQYKQLENCQKQVKEGDMPLGSYTIIHHDARLTDIEKEILTSWFQTIRDQIKAKYPADSLVLQRRNATAAAQETPAQTLLALSKKDHTLAIVDPATLKVIAKVPVGSDPHEVIASSDGRTAYVSIYGGGSLHGINVIDLPGQRAMSTIDTRPFYGPHGLDFAGGKLWFTAEGSKCVARYDPATNTFDWAMGTGQDRTHMLFVTPDERKVYTTNVSSGTVSILTDSFLQPPPAAPPGARPHEDWIQTLIPVSRGSEGFDVSPDGRELWTASAEDGTIAIIDLATKKVIRKIDAKVQGANRLKFTPNGANVLITSLRNGDLVVYDAATRKETKKVNIGHGAAGILMSRDGSRAFLGCTADDYVAVIDLKNLSVNAHIDVGGGPDGLAWAIRR